MFFQSIHDMLFGFKLDIILDFQNYRFWEREYDEYFLNKNEG